MQHIIINWKNETIRLEIVNYEIDDNWIRIFNCNHSRQINIPIQEISYYSESQFPINQFNTDYFFKFTLKDNFSGFYLLRSQLWSLEPEQE